MKHLLLTRHAKSSWDFINLDDFDRPLNERGKRDAPAMAKRLFKKDINIDLFVSSPAVRALTTAGHFAEAYDQKHKHIVQVPELYEASVATFYKVVAGLDNDVKSVALFSHNPGITDFVNSFKLAFVDNIPTCGVFAIKIPIKKWSDFKDAPKEFWFFDYPKAEG